MKREAFILKTADQLQEISFEVENLKIFVEKKGLGDTPEWMNTYHTFKERMEEIRFHLKMIKQHKNLLLKAIIKLHIEYLMRQFRFLFLSTAREYGYEAMSNDIEKTR